MRAHVIEGGMVVNTIEVATLDALPGVTLVDADEVGGSIGWSYADGVASPPTPPVLTLAERKAAMLETLRARFRVVRDQGTTIDFGGGAVTIQTTPDAANDIQRLHDDLKLRAANGEEDPTQDIATSAYVVVPGVTVAMAAAMREAVAAHWRATWARDAALGGAVKAVADDANPTTGNAALDLIDVQAGTIDGAGGWPG
jgi:hypothetical protein